METRTGDYPARLLLAYSGIITCMRTIACIPCSFHLREVLNVTNTGAYRATQHCRYQERCRLVEKCKFVPDEDLRGRNVAPLQLLHLLLRECSLSLLIIWSRSNEPLQYHGCSNFAWMQSSLQTLLGLSTVQPHCVQIYMCTGNLKKVRLIRLRSKVFLKNSFSKSHQTTKDPTDPDLRTEDHPRLAWRTSHAQII